VGSLVQCLVGLEITKSVPQKKPITSFPLMRAKVQLLAIIMVEGGDEKHDHKPNI